MKKSLLITYAVVSCLLFTIFLANIDTIGGYIDSLFNSAIQNFLSETDRFYFYVIKLLFYFFSFLWAQKKFDQRPFFTFLCIIIPVVLLDATVFIDGINLIPLRFPFETLFPILGTSGALIKVTFQRKVFFLFISFITLFIIISKLYLIPEIVLLMEKRDSNRVVTRSPFGHGYFLTINGDSTRLEDTATSKALLVDYYFVGCPPCELKLKYLKQLSSKINSKDFKVFLICNGEVSTFRSYVAHAMKNNNKMFSFLYDKNGIINKTTTTEGYPYELLLDKNRKVVSTLLGFNSETALRYVSDKHKKVIAIINE